MKIFIKVSIFFIVLLIFEWGTHQWDFIQNYWYERLYTTHLKTPVKYIFIGSSRVAAVIDTEMANQDGHFRKKGNGIFYNIGQGQSNLIEHYFGLRKFFTINTKNVTNPVVFIEAPNGLPDSMTWDDCWYNRSQPQLLISLLTFKDLKLLWNSKNSLESKLFITTRFLLSSFQLITFQERIRDGLLTRSQSFFFQLFSLFDQKYTPDLSVSGGIRADLEGIKQVRRMMIKNQFSPAPSSVRPINWEDTVFYQIITLVKQHNGTLILLDIPISSYDSHFYHNSNALKNIENLKSILNKWDISFFPNTIPTTNQDFPDLLHLRSSLRKEFTKQILEQLKRTTYERTRTNNP